MNLRNSIAEHPGFVIAIEHLSDAILKATAEAGETALIDIVPLGVFARPLVVGLVEEFRAALASRIDHELDEFIQAQPTVKAGDGHAGLIDISETSSRAKNQ